MAKALGVTREQVLGDLSGDNSVGGDVDDGRSRPDGIQRDPNGDPIGGSLNEGGDTKPDGQPGSGTDEKYKDLEKFIGKQANELGETRAQVTELLELVKKLKSPEGGGVPDGGGDDEEDDGLEPPHPDDFPGDPKAYRKAVKTYERNRDTLKAKVNDQKAAISAREKAWADAVSSGRVTKEQQAAAAKFYANPANLDPEFVVLAMEMRQDPHKFLREAATKLQNLLNREVTPTTSGAGGNNGVGAPTSAERASYDNIQKLLNENKFREHDAALDAHFAKYGRCVAIPA